jgi:pentalenene synthase
MPHGIDLHIPFSSRRSSDFARADACHLDWPRRFGLFPDPDAERRHRRAGSADLAARFYPTAAGADLDLGVDQMSWFFRFDDQFDGPAGFDPATAMALVDSFMQVLQKPQATGPPLVRAFADLWCRSREGMSDRWRWRAARDWRAYFYGQVMGSRARGERRVPVYADHLRIRRDSVGVRPVLNLAERIGHFECPARALADPLLGEMVHITVDVVIFGNEIVWAEKEGELGDNNLVLILQRERRITRDAAIAAIRAMVRESTEHYLALERELPRLSDDLFLKRTQRESLRRYSADCLKAAMRGSYDWNQHTGRYLTSAPVHPAPEWRANPIVDSDQRPMSRVSA